jgi:hypothetical protein
MGQKELLIMYANMQMCIVAGDNWRANNVTSVTSVGSSHINQMKLNLTSKIHGIKKTKMRTECKVHSFTILKTSATVSQALPVKRVKTIIMHGKCCYSLLVL